MILRIINSFIFGFILVALLDFLLFIGVKLNYFDFYNIKEYFNILFFDNQNHIFIIIASLISGYLMMYSKISKIFDGFYILMLLLFTLTLYPPIGKYAGETLFLEKDKEFSTGDSEFIGDLLYKGRDFTYIKRDGIKKAIKLPKEDLVILN